MSTFIQIFNEQSLPYFKQKYKIPKLKIATFVEFDMAINYRKREKRHWFGL